MIWLKFCTCIALTCAHREDDSTRILLMQCGAITIHQPVRIDGNINDDTRGKESILSDRFVSTRTPNFQLDQSDSDESSIFLSTCLYCYFIATVSYRHYYAFSLLQRPALQKQILHFYDPESFQVNSFVHVHFEYLLVLHEAGEKHTRLNHKPHPPHRRSVCLLRSRRASESSAFSVVDAFKLPLDQQEQL